MDAIEQVREGMDVVDGSGQQVGTVKAVKLGDPQAVTSQGQSAEGEGGLIGAVLDSLGAGADLPAQRREQLLRVGYIEVDAKGIGGDFFEAADAVERVADGVVHLNVTR